MRTVGRDTPLEFEPWSARSPIDRILSGLKWLWEGLAFSGALLIFGTGGLIFSLFCWVGQFILPKRSGSVFGRWAIQKLFRFFVGYLQFTGLMKVEFRDEDLELLNQEEGVIIAPNHPTLLDAVVMLSRLPRSVCIIKACLWRNPFLGGAHLARYIRNDSHGELIRQSVKALEEGGQLLVFPEGTRTVVEPVNEFKRGFALMAKKAQVPVQTVLIETDTEAYRKGKPFFQRPQFPVCFQIRLGERFEPDEDENLREWVGDLQEYYQGELR